MKVCRASPDLRGAIRAGQLLPRLPGAAAGGGEGLTAVIREACVQGISTRSVDELVEALGMSDVSKSQVSRFRTWLKESLAPYPVAAQRSDQ